MDLFRWYPTLRAVIALFILSLSAGSAAQSIHAYKSVHADGTVSYSDTRPASASNVTTVSIPKTDSDIVRQGHKRKQEMQQNATALEKQRAAQAEARRKYEKNLAQARSELSSAERNLISTQQSKHNATEARIALAEERVQLARQRLREIQNAGP